MGTTTVPSMSRSFGLSERMTGREILLHESHGLIAQSNDIAVLERDLCVDSTPLTNVPLRLSRSWIVRSHRRLHGSRRGGGRATDRQARGRCAWTCRS